MELALTLGTFAVSLAGITAGLVWALRLILRDVADTVSKVAAETAQSVAISASESSRAVLEGVMATIVGDNNPVAQAERVPEGDILDPEWMKWGEEDETDDEVGVGDSVWVDSREAENRVASIKDGESIIPGVPLPDMSGEKYQP